MINKKGKNKRQNINPAADEMIFKVLFEHSNEMIFLAASDNRLKPGIFTAVNMKTTEVLGYSKQELLKMCLNDLYADKESVKPFIKKLKYGSSAFECQLKTKKGIIINAEISYSQFKFRGEIMLLTSVTDISSRKKMEIVLKQSEKYFRALIEKSSDIILAVDKNKIIKYASRSIESSLGYLPEDVIGTDLSALFVVSPKDSGQAMFWKIILNGQPVKMEFNITAKNGAAKVIEMAAQNLLNDDGISSIIISGRDITDRKRTEENLKLAIHDLEQSNSDLEQFAYVASHDLKEPLRMISNYLELLILRYGRELKAEAVEFVGFAIDGTKRMYGLIQGLLDYSRLGKGMILSEPFNIADVIINCLSNLNYDKKHDIINIEKMPSIRANYTEVLQLFQNLLSNAIKFSPKGGAVINISCEKSDNKFLFTVADNGIGIEKQYLTRVFKLFERLHTDSEYSGTGIGLTLCKKIVENMGGNIWIESELNKGAKVKFTIPNKGENDNGK